MEVYTDNTPNSLSLSSLLALHDEASIKFSPIWQACEENERFRMIKNWSEPQHQEIIKQGRVPYSMPIVQTKLMSISGYQKTVRTEFKVEEGVDPQDEVKAAIAELALRDIARQSRYQEIESEMFDDGLYIKFGCVENYLDTDCVPAMPKVKTIDYKNVIWDPNAIKYDLSDALFMAKIEKFYRYQLESKFGKEALDSPAGDNYAFMGREKNPYYVGTRLDGQTAYDLISVFTHYQKVERLYHCVLFPDTMGLYGSAMIYEEFRSKKEADMRLRELNLQYILNDLPAEGSVERKEIVKLDKYVFTYSAILEHEETEMGEEEYPFTMFFAIHQKGQFISMMDFLKSPQQFADRMISQTDYSLGKSLKNVYQMDPNLLADGETIESATRKARDGGIILGNNNNNQDLIRHINQNPINPQYLQIYQLATGVIEDGAGGRSFQGLSEGANEPGKAIIAKQRMGEIIAGNFLDNLSKTKRAIGRKLLWWIRNYDTAERIIQVNGGELSPVMVQLLTQNGLYSQNPIRKTAGYLRINTPDSNLSWLKDAEFELVVTEDEYSETNKEKKLAMNLEAAKIIPMLTQTPVWQQKMLTGLGFSFDEVQEMMMQMTDMQRQQMINDAMMSGAKQIGNQVS